MLCQKYKLESKAYIETYYKGMNRKDDREEKAYTNQDNSVYGVNNTSLNIFFSFLRILSSSAKIIILH